LAAIGAIASKARFREVAVAVLVMARCSAYQGRQAVGKGMLMIRFLAAIGLYFSALTASFAQSSAPIDTLFEALGFPEIIAVMREEGIVYGAAMEEDLFQRTGGLRWRAMVEAIYDLDRMTRIVRNRMDSELAAEDLKPMIDFFLSDLGRQIVSLEVSARTAMLQDGVEEAGNDAYRALKDSGGARLGLLDDFVTASDLIESNVVGAMNSNYAFYTSLADGGAFPDMLTQDQILTDVWSEEDAIRDDTRLWVYSYLTLAYQPLSDAELQAYTAFFKTDAGRALNNAIFAAFDEMFVAISQALGQGAAQFLAGEEL